MNYVIEFSGISCPDGVAMVQPRPQAINENLATARQERAGLGDIRGILGRVLSKSEEEEMEAAFRRREVPQLGGEWPFSPPSPPLPPLFPPAILKIEPSGPTLRYQSARRNNYTRRLGSLKDLIVMRFLSCRPVDESPDDMIAFADEYGLPAWVPALGEIELKAPEVLRRILVGMVGWYTEGYRDDALNLLSRERAFADLRPVLAVLRGRKVPELRMTVQSLCGFMILELGSVIAAGARITRCEHCGAYFATGKGTGRRQTAKYDTNRCRVNAQRAAARAAADARGDNTPRPTLKRRGVRGRGF